MLLGVGLFAGTLSAQQIKGVVKDPSGVPLPGVAVQVVGTSSGVSTDANGNFTLAVQDARAAVLRFSFIGMKPRVVEVNGRTSLEITLEEEVTMLDEVVAIGYGVAKRKDVTGSVASIRAEALVAIPVSSAVEAMAGKLAGVQVTTTEGSPDAEMKIRVRGGGSITGDNTPLFIVDGFPVPNISDIAPTEIETIDVLKDASSTAIYGARGANGVVIVTTKSGRGGKTHVSYNAYYAFKKIAKTMDVLAPNDYVKWQYELAALKNSSDLTSYENYFGAYRDIDLYDEARGTRWQEQVYGRVGEVFNQSLGVSGGGEKSAYAFNYSHTKDKAIMVRSDFKRDNVSFKLNHKPNQWISLDFLARYSDTEINGGGTNEQNEISRSDSRMKHSVIFSPIPMGGISSDGSDEDTYGDLVNPLVAIRDNDRTQSRTNYNLGAALAWKISPGLTVKTEIGLDHNTSQSNRFYGVTTYYVSNKPEAALQGMPAVELTGKKRRAFRNTNTLAYDFKALLPDLHRLNLLLGEESLTASSSTMTNTIHGFPAQFTFANTVNLTTQGGRAFTENNFSPDDKLLSFFGRLNYDYDSKYIFSVTFRVDGSSKFAEGNRQGYFPSAALAWRLSSESFMDRAREWLDDLKLRFSYGTAGNNNIPAGQMAQTFESKATTWINGTDSYWAASKTMANPRLKWETTYTRNLGLDFTMFRSRLNGGVEFYLNSTKDLLIQFPVAGTGYDTQYRNMGETQNKGVEVSLNYVAVNEAHYGLNVNFNIGFNKNEIKSLGIMKDFTQHSDWTNEFSDDFRVAVGGSVGEMYGFVADGRYEVDDFVGYDGTKWELKPGVADNKNFVKVRPGALKIKDQPTNEDGSGDLVIDDKDRVVIGNANPLHTGGLTLNGRLYGFDLSAVFNWSYGNDVYNANKIEYTSSSKYQYRNMISGMADGKRWTNLRADGTISNDPSELEEMNRNTTMWSPYTDKYVFTDWAVEDGSFLRLNTLTLGYTLPASFTTRARVERLRLYVTGYNLFCLTSYSGADPEVSTRRKTNLTPGVDYSAYPKSRQLVFGINLNF
ncbi:MAG: TonB-dependent receptor [Odoribacteraceae bacterium]|jgi:TonB-linked SusC/RagA family outer membrane protein|nr:TonB-dependent receptor [Odoribacteraceae bacterium]